MVVGRCLIEKKNVEIKTPEYFVNARGGVMARGPCSTPKCPGVPHAMVKFDNVPDHLKAALKKEMDIIKAKPKVPRAKKTKKKSKKGGSTKSSERSSKKSSGSGSKKSSRKGSKRGGSSKKGSKKRGSAKKRGTKKSSTK